jgi:hypothetical protein
MSVIKFKQDILNAILELLWKQWTQLGVAGQISTKNPFVLDPEALLIFSAHFARYDQRLYDLVINWLQCNGESINLPRLKAILKLSVDADPKSLGFISASVKMKKWNAFAKTLLPQNVKIEPLFFENNFAPQLDEIALHYGFKRNIYVPNNKVMSFPIQGNASLLLRLRGAFGMSARAEAVLAMLDKNFCRIQDVADLGCFSWKAARDVLDELYSSGVVITLDKNKRRRTYFLKSSNAICRLFEIEKVIFPDWITIFNMLTTVWLCFNTPRITEVSEKTALSQFEREFITKNNDSLQNCKIASLSKLTPNSIFNLPKIIQEIN